MPHKKFPPCCAAGREHPAEYFVFSTVYLTGGASDDRIRGFSGDWPCMAGCGSHPEEKAPDDIKKRGDPGSPRFCFEERKKERLANASRSFFMVTRTGIEPMLPP